MAQNVRFIAVKLQSSFDALTKKDPLALYFIQDTNRFYHGARLMGTGALASEQAAGLISADDYIKLQELMTGGGLSNLTAVDGTITIADTVEGGKSIGVSIAPVENNALVAVDGGLFVPTVAVPEYTIEKVETEEGFASSYKLKKISGNEVSYVGDTINIAKNLVLQSATLETVTEDGVPYADAQIGDPYIKMVFSNEDASNLYIPVKGLVDTYAAGDGIEIIDNKIGVKLADNTHGLVAVDGALTLNLATKDSDGAMSKEDKTFIDALKELNISGEYATKEEVQSVRESVAQIEQSYSWSEM